MDNHFHLVLETPGANLGRFMQSVLTGYTVCYNLRHRCHGHLTQGRYGARLVKGDNYLLKLSRYVHLNPVNVKKQAVRPHPELVEYLRAYAWSSYRGYIGQAKRLEWVVYDPMLALVGGRKGKRGERYRQFVESGMAANDEEFLVALQRSARSIGDDDYREWVDERYAELLSERRRPEDVSFRTGAGKRLAVAGVLEMVAKAAGTTVAGLGARRRGGKWKGIAALLLVKHVGLTRRDCVRWLGLKAGSGVSYQMRQAGQALEADATLARVMERLDSMLSAQARK